MGVAPELRVDFENNLLEGLHFVLFFLRIILFFCRMP
jgi:hypothetical protein